MLFPCMIRFHQYPASGIENPSLDGQSFMELCSPMLPIKGRKVGKVRGLSTEKMESTKGQPRVAWSGAEKACTTKPQKSSNFYKLGQDMLAVSSTKHAKSVCSRIFRLFHVQCPKCGGFSQIRASWDRLVIGIG